MKKSITIRLDEDVLEWFKGKGRYQSEINSVLRSFMLAEMPVDDIEYKSPRQVRVVVGGEVLEGEETIAGKIEEIKSRKSYPQKYKDANPMERCSGCGKALRYCGC